MCEVKTLKDRLTEDIKKFQSPQHPIFKDTLLDLQKHAHTFNEIKKRLNRLWRMIFTNETDYVLGKKGTPSIINYEKKIAVVLTVNTSIRNKEVSLQRLEKFSEENPEYKLVYAVINGAPEEYYIDRSSSKANSSILCLSGDKVFDFILGDRKDEVLNELKKYIQKVPL